MKRYTRPNPGCLRFETTRKHARNGAAMLSRKRSLCFRTWNPSICIAPIDGSRLIRAHVRCLTNSVYLPRRDASQGASTQTRRINLVGLNRRLEDGRVGDKGVCEVCARMHAQIMTGDLSLVLICAIDFASIARPNECAAPLRAIQMRKY